MIKIGEHEFERVDLDKALAKVKLRIVGMEDVTVNEEQLVRLLLSKAGIAGNECRNRARAIIKELVFTGNQYAEGEDVVEEVEGSGETSS